MSQDELSSQAPLALYLCDRDMPCPGCGYNLRGITTNKCPECSRDIAIQLIGSAEFPVRIHRLSLWTNWLLLMFFVYRFLRELLFPLINEWRYLDLGPLMRSQIIVSFTLGALSSMVPMILLAVGLVSRARSSTTRSSASIQAVRMMLWASIAFAAIEIVSREIWHFV